MEDDFGWGALVSVGLGQKKGRDIKRKHIEVRKTCSNHKSSPWAQKIKMIDEDSPLIDL